jgi:hypothetical protein
VQNLPYVQDGEGKNEQHRVAQFWQDRAPCGDTVIRDAVSAGDPDAPTAQASLLAVGLMRQLTSMIGARRFPSMCERRGHRPCVPNPDLNPQLYSRTLLTTPPSGGCIQAFP